MGIVGTNLDIIKPNINKARAKFILDGKKLKAFRLRSETRQGCPFLPLGFNTLFLVLARLGTQQKEKKDIQIGK